MNLLEFKTYIESLPDNTQFNYSISEPFSWRGSYDEVAFSIEEKPTTKEEILRRINLAYTETFRGYKGGEYNYHDWTPINFESGHHAYTDKIYTKEIIKKIKNDAECLNLEEQLIKLAFPKI